MHSKSLYNPTRCRREMGGFVLITALIFLVVLSALTLMAMRKSIFEERMAGNDRDTVFAREAADLALRDAEHDIAGLRFDGAYCAVVGSTTCGGNLRPTGNRPANAVDAGNFWTLSNDQYSSIGNAAVSTSTTRTSPMTGSENGVYTRSAAIACGKPLWQAADWDADVPASGHKCTDNASIVRTTIYGEFTGAPTTTFVRPPRYLIEIFDATDMGIANSSKVYFRITAVGFGRISNDAGGLTSVTLQSIYSPL
jgi:type IV pilus assembly protein PilX